MKSFINEIVDNLGELAVEGGSTRVAAVRFSSHAHVEFPLSRYANDREGLRTAIINIPYDGHKTNTPEAFQVADKVIYQTYYGDRLMSPNVIIIITDGKPEVSRNRFAVEETIRASETLQRRGVKVFAVGVTNEAVNNPISIATLEGMSSDPRMENVTYWRTADFTSLMSIISDVPKKACYEIKRARGLV